MSRPFANQVIIITGAGSGIGKATSIKLAQLGATLAICDINSDSLSSLSTILTELNCTHFCDAIDVGNSGHATTFVDHIMITYGRLNHVFNCAGINPTYLPTSSISDDYWDKVINTNLKGLFNMTRACIPILKPGSTFVNTSSILGLQPGAGYAAYCASKYGIIGFSKCMALELGEKGIRTNVVAPGYIDTPTNAVVVKGGEAVKEMEGNVALGRFGTAEEVADVVVFLMGEGGRYMNGSVVEVSGGVK